jgi:hypothetical protein
MKAEMIDISSALQERLNEIPNIVTLYRVSEARKGRPKLITARYRAKMRGNFLIWEAFEWQKNDPKTMPPHWPHELCDIGLINWRIAERPSAAWDLYLREKERRLVSAVKELEQLQVVVRKAQKRFDEALREEAQQ